MKALRGFIIWIVAVLFACGVARGQNFGWDPIPEEADALARETDPIYGGQISLLVDRADYRNALIYRYVARLLEQDRLQAINQLDAGSCVGCATALAIDVASGVEIGHRGEPERFVSRYSPDAIYAMGRHIAGRLHGRDGSTGAWSCRAIREWGTLIQQPYGDADLTKYDPRRAQKWARHGVPLALIESAKEHPVRATTRIKTTDQARACLQNGYPIIICSRESYGGSNKYQTSRDKDGFARNDGKDRWAHAMCVVGYRGPQSGREGFLVMNSWGNKFGTGPIWPEDQPFGSFWISPADLQQHLNFGDSWAVGDIVGFPERDLTLRRAIDVGGREIETNYLLAP